ncbi:MAG: hypothetical protein LBN23_08720 [Paludibacter sp.]|jgi:mRNA interferase RelE/StbE|nr:hypothetical protein [Paludibacter sp.]
MKVTFTKKFEKQLDTVRDKSLVQKISKIVQEVILATEVSKIGNLKKLKGHDTAYRIRSGTYRIGVFIEEQSVIFACFAHRKDIYNEFPS